MSVADPLTGGCMCGKYRYAASGASNAQLICHCESCRRHTGAPVVAFAGFAKDQVQWSPTDPPRFASSPKVGRAFCESCGTPMTWEGDGLVELLVGTLDDPDGFVPAFHIHHGEHLPWIDTADRLPRYLVWEDDPEGPYLNAPARLSADQQIALVERYFAAVDGEDLQGVLETLSDGCVFTVETHGVILTGRDEIAAMFRRLWSNHRSVRHHDFRFVPDPAGNRISVQFKVENTETDGSLTRKSNCNFFDFDGPVFSHIAVYMAGPNTLDKPT